MEWQMERGEMLRDLIDLLKQRGSTKGDKRKLLDDKIIARHALPWFEGSIEEPTKRLSIFIKKARKLVSSVSMKYHNKQFLADAWMDGISDIEEGYEDKNFKTQLLGPSKEYDEYMDDIFRIWHYLGHKPQKQQMIYAASPETEKYIKKVTKKQDSEVKEYQEKVMSTAQDRFLSIRDD